MEKKILFLLISFSIYSLSKNRCFNHLCSNKKPIFAREQCDPFNEPLCITYPKEGQVFVTNACSTGCALCLCSNGFQCTQRVLNNLTVAGTTRQPNQVVTVLLINTKLSSGDTPNSLEEVTKSKPAPNGIGIWSVTFKSIPTPRPPPFKTDGIPTTISVSVNSDWNTNYASSTIFIRKDKDCDLDCDIVCRRYQTITKLCKLHIHDNLTKAIKNKYN